MGFKHKPRFLIIKVGRAHLSGFRDFISVIVSVERIKELNRKMDTWSLICLQAKQIVRHNVLDHIGKALNYKLYTP